MANNDFTYCKGNRCALREHCVRFVEGCKLPEDNMEWMQSCDELTRMGFIETA